MSDLTCRTLAGKLTGSSDLSIWRALVRAVEWAAYALTHDDTTVSALARHLGLDGDAIEVEGKARVGRPERLQKVTTLGVNLSTSGDRRGSESISGRDHHGPFHP